MAQSVHWELPGYWERYRLWSLPRKKDEEIYRARRESVYGEAAQVTAQVKEIDLTTEHAGLILEGYFAQPLG